MKSNEACDVWGERSGGKNRGGGEGKIKTYGIPKGDFQKSGKEATGEQNISDGGET